MKRKFLYPILVLAVAAALIASYQWIGTKSDAVFDGEIAFQHINKQLDFGPRAPGTEAHTKFIEWIQPELVKQGWKVELQTGAAMGHPLTNIIAKKGQPGSKLIILGAHFDSRLMADRQEPGSAGFSDAVPGANDGASGVAVLLELARVIRIPPEYEIWLVFFDLEDQGDIPGWDWILGSRYFAEQLTQTPQAVVILDMVGDANLNIPLEINSSESLQAGLWKTAKSLGYSDVFLNRRGNSILDDHTPFLEKGFLAVDIIDFDYPDWHKQSDTLDKVSSNSLEAVGRTVEAWIETDISLR